MEVEKQQLQHLALLPQVEEGPGRLDDNDNVSHHDHDYNNDNVSHHDQNS